MFSRHNGLVRGFWSKYFLKTKFLQLHCKENFVPVLLICRPVPQTLFMNGFFHILSHVYLLVPNSFKFANHLEKKRLLANIMVDFWYFSKYLFFTYHLHVISCNQASLVVVECIYTVSVSLFITCLLLFCKL